MPLHKTAAVILKSTRWGEADRIVTCYTLKLGKLRAVARGARRMKSRFGSALEPFTHSELNLFEKHGDTLYRLTQADLQEPFAYLRQDLTLMGAAARIVNLVGAMTVDADRDALVFETLLQGLRALECSDDPRLTALVFQFRLLEGVGFRPQIDECAACGARPSERAAFAPEAGGMLCRACAPRGRGPCLPLSAGGWAFLRQASRMEPSALVRLKATGRMRHELTGAIEQFVCATAGTRLPTIDFLAAEDPGPVYEMTP